MAEIKLPFKIPFFSGVSLKERAFFARQLSIMLAAGMQLDQALAILAGQTRNNNLRLAVLDIIKQLETGHSFSVALSRHTDEFGSVFAAVIRGGEASGRLDTVLEELAKQLENETRSMNAVKGALVYPLFILAAMIVMAVVVIIKVIPQLKDIFTSAKVDLPLQTTILLKLSDFFSAWWWLVLILVIVLIVVLRYLATKTDVGHYYWNKLQVNPPLGKSITQGTYMLRFSRTLSMLVSAGIPIIEAINITAETMNNIIYEQSLKEVVGELERGVPMSVPLEKNANFPPIVSQMVHVGEQTGRLDEVLNNISYFFEDDVNTKTKALTSLFEPILIVILGLGVMFMVFAILVPIYSITQAQG